MRLRFTEPHDGETSRVPRRWQRQIRRASGAQSDSPLDSGYMPPYTGVRVNVAGIKFVGGASDSITNPLYDRQHQIRINGTFVYNPLLPISKNPDPNDDNNWVSDSWRFHQVGILGNHSIYDPIIMIDRENPRVPTNMTKAAYKRAIFEARDFLWQSNALVTKVN